MLSKSDPHFSWPPQIFLSFPLYPHLPSPFTPHTHAQTHSSSPSPHTPPLWSCHLSAPAQSLLRPTAHLPPAPLTAPVANANAHTHPHLLRHTKGCIKPHLPWCTYRHAQRNTVTHICIQTKYLCAQYFWWSNDHFKVSWHSRMSVSLSDSIYECIIIRSCMQILKWHFKQLFKHCSL